MIRIKNWEKYQSYKDRKPPWIRFHRTILDDYVFQSMSADSRALLPMLWLLACENDDPKSGKITYSIESVSWRLRIRNEIVTKSLRELQTSGFIEFSESRNESVTKPLRNRNETVTPETETETDTENYSCQQQQKKAAELIAMMFPVKGGVWELTEKKLKEYQATFPGIDCRAEAAKARQWCADNPPKQKTSAGMGRFLNSWLSRASEGRAGKFLADVDVSDVPF